MASHPSVTQYYSSLNERWRVFKESLESLWNALSGGNADAKTNACRELLTALDHLKGHISVEYYPAWMIPLRNALSTVLSSASGQNVRNLLRALASNDVALQTQSWTREGFEEDQGINFDGIYERSYSTSRLPDLFQQLVDKLEELVASGEIDSRRALNAVEKLIATIKKNMRGSYYSTRGTLKFARSLVVNTGWELLSDIPVVGSIVKGLRTALDEADEEMKRVEQEMKDTLEEQTRVNIAAIDSVQRLPLSLPKPEGTTD